MIEDIDIPTKNFELTLVITIRSLIRYHQASLIITDELFMYYVRVKVAKYRKIFFIFLPHQSYLDPKTCFEMCSQIPKNQPESHTQISSKNCPKVLMLSKNWNFGYQSFACPAKVQRDQKLQELKRRHLFNLWFHGKKLKILPKIWPPVPYITKCQNLHLSLSKQALFYLLHKF